MENWGSRSLLQVYGETTEGFFVVFFFFKKEVCGDRKRATQLFFRFVFLTLDQLIVCFNVPCRAISP